MRIIEEEFIYKEAFFVCAALREPHKRVHAINRGSDTGAMVAELMVRLLVKIISLDHIGTLFIMCNNNLKKISLNKVYAQNCSFQ